MLNRLVIVAFLLSTQAAFGASRLENGRRANSLNPRRFTSAVRYLEVQAIERRDTRTVRVMARSGGYERAPLDLPPGAWPSILRFDSRGKAAVSNYPAAGLSAGALLIAAEEGGIRGAVIPSARNVSPQQTMLVGAGQLARRSVIRRVARLAGIVGKPTVRLTSAEFFDASDGRFKVRLEAELSGKNRLGRTMRMPFAGNSEVIGDPTFGVSALRLSGLKGGN